MEVIKRGDQDVDILNKTLNEAIKSAIANSIEGKGEKSTRIENEDVQEIKKLQKKKGRTLKDKDKINISKDRAKYNIKMHKNKNKTETESGKGGNHKSSNRGKQKHQKNEETAQIRSAMVFVLQKQ